MKLLGAVFLSILICSGVIAQNIETDSLTEEKNLKLSVGSLLSTGSDAPFWIQGNNSQRLTTDPNTLFIEAEGVQPLFTKNRFSLDLGFDLIARQSGKTTGDIIQGYVQTNLGKVAFFGGRKEEIFGVRDTLLAVGPFVNGNNSLPIPKIALYSKDWIDIPFTKEYFQFQFYYAHGWFEKDRAVISPFLHQKYLYLRLSNESLPFSLFAGLTHQVQWGGTILSSGKKLSSSLNDYRRIFFGKSGTDESMRSDFLNALGNHLGNYDLGFTLELGQWDLLSYLNLLYEDHSGLQIKNFADGKLGISVSREKGYLFEGFLFEIFDTTDQNGNKYDGDGNFYFEPDNFFNNGTYSGGWSYNNQSIGNVMFHIPDKNEYGTFRIKSSVSGFNLGIRGSLYGSRYTLKYTNYKNKGNLLENTLKNIDFENLVLSNLNFSLNRNLKSNLLVRGILNYQWGNFAKNGIGLFFLVTKNF